MLCFTEEGFTGIILTCSPSADCILHLSLYSFQAPAGSLSLRSPSSSDPLPLSSNAVFSVCSGMSDCLAGVRLGKCCALSLRFDVSSTFTSLKESFVWLCQYYSLTPLLQMAFRWRSLRAAIEDYRSVSNIVACRVECDPQKVWANILRAIWLHL